ncbi:MAG: Hsp20/alpha crystallin family protein [bacterium]
MNALRKRRNQRDQFTPSIDPFLKSFFGIDEDDLFKDYALEGFTYDSENEEYVGYFELPGLNKKDVEIKTDGNKLIIKGQVSDEKKQEKIGKREVYYEKEFRDKIKDDSIYAKLEDGILELRFKFKGESSMKSIDIQ